MQKILPHHLLGSIVRGATRSEMQWLKNLLIRRFVASFQPAMDDALQPDPLAYPSFNAFFTRALRADARTLDPAAARIVSPCDGTLSVADYYDAGRGVRMIQAKGHDYEVGDLLAGSASAMEPLGQGAYATIYLAPYNYHRIHMPCAGELLGAWLVPGRLFSVNAATTAGLPNLFARNERVVCLFRGETGLFAVILVGALLVGSMETVWHGLITPWSGRRLSGGAVALTPRTEVPLRLERGAELGRFNMGSTVILLFPGTQVTWDAPAADPTIRMGRGIGTRQ